LTARQIHLLRHAKSSRDDAELSDHERPLAARGVKATQLLREHLRAIGLAPDLVLCSSARRALQTLDGVREGLPPETAVEVEDRLYSAGPAELLSRLQELPEQVGSVMLIGHNPAVEELARELIGFGDHATRTRIEAKYPTGGLASLRFEVPWAQLDGGKATVESFVVPKDLG
jgi:phosphohistidine phosphatase